MKKKLCFVVSAFLIAAALPSWALGDVRDAGSKIRGDYGINSGRFENPNRVPGSGQSVMTMPAAQPERSFSYQPAPAASAPAMPCDASAAAPSAPVAPQAMRQAERRFSYQPQQQGQAVQAMPMRRTTRDGLSMDPYRNPIHSAAAKATY